MIIKIVRNNHLDYHEPSNEEYLKLKEAFEKNDIKVVSCMENKYQIGDERIAASALNMLLKEQASFLKNGRQEIVIV